VWPSCPKTFVRIETVAFQKSLALLAKRCVIVQEDAYQRHAVVMHKVVNVRHHVRVEVCVPIVTHVSAQATVLRFGADVRKRV
jgi:hypothetical protein